jgi:hypothetical protein
MKKLLKCSQSRSDKRKCGRISDSLYLLMKTGKILAIFPLKNVDKPLEKNFNRKSIIFICSCFFWVVDLLVVLMTISDWVYMKFDVSKFGKRKMQKLER